MDMDMDMDMDIDMAHMDMAHMDMDMGPTCGSLYSSLPPPPQPSLMCRSLAHDFYHHRRRRYSDEIAERAAELDREGWRQRDRDVFKTVSVWARAQSGRLGTAISDHHGLHRLRLRARGCPPHS